MQTITSIREFYKRLSEGETLKDCDGDLWKTDDDKLLRVIEGEFEWNEEDSVDFKCFGPWTTFEGLPPAKKELMSPLAVMHFIAMNPTTVVMLKDGDEFYLGSTQDIKDVAMWQWNNIVSTAHGLELEFEEWKEFLV